MTQEMDYLLEAARKTFPHSWIVVQTPWFNGGCTALDGSNWRAVSAVTISQPVVPPMEPETGLTPVGEWLLRMWHTKIPRLWFLPVGGPYQRADLVLWGLHDDWRPMKRGRQGGYVRRTLMRDIWKKR